MDKNFAERLKNIINIKKELLNELEDNVFCAIAYGSAIGEDFYCHSDYDILIFLKRCSLNEFQKLKKIKQMFLCQKIRIDLNVHTINEIPIVRGRCFWHNNRSLYFQKEMILYGITIIGKNPFAHNDFNENDLRIESIRVVNSLLYQARKMLINKDINEAEKINLMKWCIYSVFYALSFKGIITKTKSEAFEIFPNYFSLNINPIIFLKAKQNNNVSEELIQKAYIFLEQLDSNLFEEYNNARK
ncbi:MAG: hypothetical protein LBD57_06510 [Endomicrobium sp.]|jgi:hypothetical protein|uniref:hypothetical protein n=1 Tax=Candidatus Endomicrobiellum cubanum TaxID=3242325 RepID=UPI00282AE90D|nr:hypothetical protein [Endomicrobium sp.]